MGEIMPMADALAVWAEEGRVYERENNGEPSNRRYQPLISEWSNPSGSNIRDPDLVSGGEPGELKHLSTRRKINHIEIPWVAASESGSA